MHVTGHLRSPNPAPCTNDDIPTTTQQKPNMQGWDCCQYKDAKSNLHYDLVPTNQVDPEKFNHDQYRYQMYAKPEVYDCHAKHSTGGRLRNQGVPTNYTPATTDVRALEQTMYIPIVPSNPGGETEVTFPMTPRTMGQPDITSACCVPVIPSQPGYKNLTPGILPGPCAQLNGASIQCTPGVVPSAASPGGIPGQIGPANVQCGGCAPQFMRAPSNVHGGGWLGLPDTFPATKGMAGGAPGWAPHGAPGWAPHGAPGYGSAGAQGWAPGVAPYGGAGGMCSYASKAMAVPKLQLPHYDGRMGDACNESFDGLPSNKMCVNSSVVRYEDRVNRAIQGSLETPEQKRRRMKEMVGSYGSFLHAHATQKRYGIKPRLDSLTLQGNGFQWDYPKSPNRNCYVLERNTRC